MSNRITKEDGDKILQEDGSSYLLWNSSAVTISDAGDEGFYNGESVTITGANFYASQGGGSVVIAQNSDGSGTSSTQTVTSWASDTSITVTVVKGSLSVGPNYLIITNSDSISSDGYAILLGTTPTISSTSSSSITNGQGSVQINGTNFGASQGNGYVRLHYLSSCADSGVLQTVTAWGDTQVTVTINQGSLLAGTVYFEVYSYYQISTSGYSVTLGTKTTSIASDWDIDYIPNSPLTLAHNDGTLPYDTGGGTAPSRDQFIRGATSGAVAQILSINGTAAAGFMTLTNVTARFQDNESLVWLDKIGFDNVTNGGLAVGNTITGVSSGRTGVIRFIDYYGTYGYAYSETFGNGTWTDNENIQIGGQTRALANGLGTYNHSTWTGVLVNGTLSPPSISGLLNFDGGTQLVPSDALVYGGTSAAFGTVHHQFGVTATGTLRLNDVSGIFADNESLVIHQVVNYNNLQSGQQFYVTNWVVGGTSSATGRILTLIDDGDSTGRIILASQTGTFQNGENLNVNGTQIASIENTTFTLSAATVNGTLKTTQRVNQGGLYATSLNNIRKVNTFYTYLQDTFEELDQLDDLPPMSAQVKDQQYTLINSWRIPDLSMRFFDTGSIQDETAQNIWTNLQTLGTVTGIGDTAYGAVSPEPQMYVAQNYSVLSPYWLTGHLNILVKAKTTTLSTQNSSTGQLINSGYLTVYIRTYLNTYDHYQTTQVGGAAYVPLSTTSDLNNSTGTNSLTYQSETGGPFVVGEEIATSDGTKIATVVSVTDTNPTGTLTYALLTSTNFANTDPITGSYSATSAAVNGAPTALVAGYTDITLSAFGTYSHDLNNGNGARNYDVEIDCNNRALSQVYEYLKYLTERGSTTSLRSHDGQIYEAAQNSYTPVKAAPFGSFAGGKFFGARGVWLKNIASADKNNYQLIDASGVTQIPPSSLVVTVNGVQNGDSVAVFQSTGSGSNNVKKDMFNVQTTLTNPLGYIRVLQSIPADTPASGSLRVIRYDASGLMLTEDKYAYTDWNNTNQPTYSTFNLSGTTSRTYTTSSRVYIPYIDTTAGSTSVSVSLTYVADRYLTTRVRKTGILPFTIANTLTNANVTITAVRATDSIT